MHRVIGSVCFAAFAAAAMVVGGAVPVMAQERPAHPDSVSQLDLPDDVAFAVVDFFNDPRRTRYDGDAEIAARTTVRSDVAVLEGTLTIGGRVEGSIVVVNGSVTLLPGAEVTGGILVVGGEVTGARFARVQGEILAYPERLSYREEGRRIRRVERPRGTTAAGERSLLRGRSDFLVTSGKSYNRVEGLPITFGPRIETSGSNPFRIHALAIYRTEAGLTLNTDRMGYFVRAEQFLGGRQQVRVGAIARSLVAPIEEWHLSDLENGLSTFLFHRDFRDYYERKGFTIFTQWEPRPGPVTLGAEVRLERHRSQQPGSPWTLFDNAEPWREQPLVAEGRLGSLALQAAYDSRSRAADPADGWYLSAQAEQSFDVGLASPAYLADSSTPSDALPIQLQPAQPFERFKTGLIDLRRYNRVDPESRLNFRLIAGGSLDGRALPPQRQHALGGEGSLPGYHLFSLDCGARQGLVYRPTTDESANPYFPAYGCDAFALFQAEFRGKLGFRLRLDSEPWQDGANETRGWGLDLDLAPDWVVFVDAGRGWSMDASRPDEEMAVDAGVGLLINRIGLYLAHPLTGGSGLNFFVRIGPRF
jgi:hypothetical protein